MCIIYRGLRKKAKFGIAFLYCTVILSICQGGFPLHCGLSNIDFIDAKLLITIILLDFLMSHIQVSWLNISFLANKLSP
jgi:hypothetical protein